MATRPFHEFPRAIFRSGNAEGTDTVFAHAIAALDSARLQLVPPQTGKGRARRPSGAGCFSLEGLPPAELEVLAAISGSPFPAAAVQLRIQTLSVSETGGQTS